MSKNIFIYCVSLFIVICITVSGGEYPRLWFIYSEPDQHKQKPRRDGVTFLFFGSSNLVAMERANYNAKTHHHPGNVIY